MGRAATGTIPYDHNLAAYLHAGRQSEEWQHLETTAARASDGSTRTTQLCDRHSDEVTLDEVELAVL
jgi:hypothetical protein